MVSKLAAVMIVFLSAALLIFLVNIDYSPLPNFIKKINIFSGLGAEKYPEYIVPESTPITEGSYTRSSSGQSPGKQPPSQKITPLSIAISDEGYSNFAAVMSRNKMIAAMPANGKMLLRLYNFNTGERQWEKSYVLTKGAFKEGYCEDADLVIYLDSSFVSRITNENFCDIVREAKNSGLMGYDNKISWLSFSWKYKGLVPYRDCLGF